MDKRQTACEVGVAQVVVVVAQLRGREHSLVNNHAVRERDNVELLVGDLSLNALAQKVKFCFKGVYIVGASNKNLHRARLGGFGCVAQNVGLDGHLAHLQQLETSLAGFCLND